MPINTSSQNPLYLIYRNAGPSFALFGPALLTWLIAVLGVLCNLFVILATLRTKSLRGTANFLVAMICLAEVVHQAGHTVFLAIVISGTNFIDLLTAAWLTFPQHFCLGVNLMGMLLAALDRLLAIAADGFYSRFFMQWKQCYLFTLASIAVLFSAVCSFCVISNGLKNAEMPTTGYLAEVLPVTSELGPVWFTLLITPLGLACCFYLVIGVIIRCNKSVSAKTNLRLLRSLFIILCVSIGGYALNLTAYELLLTVDFGLNPVTLWEISFVAGDLLNLCAAANAPVLYINSTEYRKAFKQQWAAIRNRNLVFSSSGGIQLRMHSLLLNQSQQPNNGAHSQKNSSQQQMNANQQAARLSVLQHSNVSGRGG